MDKQDTRDLDRVRDMATGMDCLIEEDFVLFARITPLTAEAWRKRHQGPAYILFGTRYLYPRKAVAQHLESQTRERNSVVKGLL